MYGTQTIFQPSFDFVLFENDVKMYGTQTLIVFRIFQSVFENDVKMYGTQTVIMADITTDGLRMM